MEDEETFRKRRAEMYAISRKYERLFKMNRLGLPIKNDPLIKVFEYCKNYFSGAIYKSEELRDKYGSNCVVWYDANYLPIMCAIHTNIPGNELVINPSFTKNLFIYVAEMLNFDVSIPDWREEIATIVAIHSLALVSDTLVVLYLGNDFPITLEETKSSYKMYIKSIMLGSGDYKGEYFEFLEKKIKEQNPNHFL